MYSNPLSDHLIIALSKEKNAIKTKSIQYHKNILSHASFTEIATEKISIYLQTHSSDVTLLELRVLDDPFLYDHLEGGVVHLLNPLLDIVKSAYIDSRTLLKSSHYLAEKKYQNLFLKICKSLLKKPNDPALAEQLNVLKRDREAEISLASDAAKQLIQNLKARDQAKPTPFSFRPFKQNNSNKKICQLTVNGTSYTSDEDILKVMTEHHKAKTTDSEVPDESTFFFDEIEAQFNIKIEDVVSQVLMPERISFEKKHILEVIKSFKNYSAPGPSGQNKDFFLACIRLFPNIFTEIINSLMRRPDLHLQPELKWIKERRIIFIPKNLKIQNSLKVIALYPFLKSCTKSCQNS